MKSFGTRAAALDLRSLRLFDEYMTVVRELLETCERQGSVEAARVLRLILMSWGASAGRYDANSADGALMALQTQDDHALCRALPQAEMKRLMDSLQRWCRAPVGSDRPYNLDLLAYIARFGLEEALPPRPR